MKQSIKVPGHAGVTQELDMFLESFDGVNCYFKGEMEIDGIKNFVHALEIGNNGYYMLSIENGKVNNLRAGTTTLLIYMWFDIKENQMIARVSDELLLNPELFSDWPYDDMTITFTPQPA